MDFPRNQGYGGLMQVNRKLTLTAHTLLVCAGFFASTVHAADANLEAGRMLFTKDAKPACAICHTLADAGAMGEIGPSLDDLKPDEARVLQALKTGIGQMPAFTSLTEEQRQILAKYVAQVTKAH
ncbi:MAG: cytochrome c [Sheuella sp.]|nr:cytochrome c [Sheuella sp.]